MNVNADGASQDSDAHNSEGSTRNSTRRNIRRRDGGKTRRQYISVKVSSIAHRSSGKSKLEFNSANAKSKRSPVPKIKDPLGFEPVKIAVSYAAGTDTRRMEAWRSNGTYRGGIMNRVPCAPPVWTESTPGLACA